MNTSSLKQILEKKILERICEINKLSKELDLIKPGDPNFMKKYKAISKKQKELCHSGGLIEQFRRFNSEINKNETKN